ncbi:MAG: hypothetical protein QM802_01875 [Agriterribacter sp.]
MKNEIVLRKNIRRWLIFFIIALLISGVTAFAVETELAWALSWWPKSNGILYKWLVICYEAVRNTNKNYPFIAYGYDWLAFAHIVIAVVFLGPLIDPVKNIWVVQFGCIACIMIFPLAFIAGYIREIPIFWRLIDCSFGIIGIIPLTICYKKIRLLEQVDNSSMHKKAITSIV